MIGDSRTPNIGYSTPAAIGTPAALQKKAKKQVLPNVAHNGLRKPPGSNDAGQIARQQRYAGTFDRNVGARAHGNADIGRS